MGLAALGPVLPLDAAETTAQVQLEDLTLNELRRRVLARNESVQMKLLELEIAKRGQAGEWGVFEPELKVGVEHQDNERETTAQERITAYPAIYREHNNIYDAGIESLLPLGTRVRIGANVRDLDNNIQPILGNLFTNGEYVTFVGASVVQPLLKGAWLPANLANIRLAAIASEIAFQEYRRELMLTLSTAEAAYWNLYLAQQQLLALQQSVELAETLLRDNQARLKLGRGSELEVLEAQAGLALRESKRSEARQNFIEAVNRLTSLYAQSVVSTNRKIFVVDRPALDPVSLSFFDRWQSAFDLNPDYLIQRKRLIQENIRLAYARNQRLPQLDLKASYGLNGLGDTPGSSWEDIQRQGLPSWSVGIEFRVPLGGGVKSRNELAAAKLRRKQALVSLKQLEVQIANAIHTAIHKVRSAHDDVRNYETVVSFNEDLLKTRLAQVKAGQIESRKVLEVEADLLNARISLAEAKVRYRRALLELELLDGSLLQNRGVDLTQRELEQTTLRLLRQRNISDADYRDFMKSVQLTYEARLAQASLTRPPVTVLPVWQGSGATPAASGASMSTETYEKATAVLHKEINRLESASPDLP